MGDTEAQTVNIHEAKTHLSRLIDQAANGEPFVIAKAGKPLVLGRGLLDNGYIELPISGAHTLAEESLPPLYKDPFDRMLLAQAIVEGLMLLIVE